MKTRKLGNITVSDVGMGCMAFSHGYFSLADEQYEVGVIEKGNTEIIAEIIAEKTGADMFRITADTNYPTTYESLLDISRQEKSNPPELAENVTNIADYDIVFIGYPIW